MPLFSIKKTKETIKIEGMNYGHDHTSTVNSQELATKIEHVYQGCSRYQFNEIITCPTK